MRLHQPVKIRHPQPVRLMLAVVVAQHTQHPVIQIIMLITALLVLDRVDMVHIDMGAQQLLLGLLEPELVEAVAVLRDLEVNMKQYTMPVPVVPVTSS